MDSEILRLKEFYEKWQTEKIILEYGPLRAYANNSEIQNEWKALVDPAIRKIDRGSVKISPGNYLATAPSPWHAYFYLRAQQQYVYRSGQPLYEPVDPKSVTPEHLFFRGQRCSDWDFRSSIYRKGTAAQEIERKAVLALTHYFLSTFTSDENQANIIALCFAQHYGIATSIADISCDPDIAVWFATHPYKSTCPNGEMNGIVKAVSWAAQETGSKTTFLLPPPFVKNVYTQRGLFVDTSTNDGYLKGSLALDIVFPRDTAGGEFTVIREGNSIDIWPETDEAEKKLIDWARLVASKCSSEEDIKHFVKKYKEEDSLPDFSLQKKLYDHDEVITEWLPILDWVLPATCVAARPAPPGSAQPMEYPILDLKVKSLIRSNPTFFRNLLSASEESKFEGYFAVLKSILDICKKELAIQ